MAARNEEVKTLKARSKSLKNSLRDSEDRCAELERASKALQAQLDDERTSRTEKISQLEAELLARDGRIKALSEAAEQSLSVHNSKAEATIQELKRRLQLLLLCYTLLALTDAI